MDILEAVGGQAKGRPGAGRLSGLLAVEDQLAASWDQVVWMPQRLGSEPVRSRDPVGSRFEVQRRSQVDDHEGVTGLQPSFELDRSDASLHEMTEEVLPSDVLEHEPDDQRPSDNGDQRYLDAHGLGHRQTDDIGEEIT